MSKKELNLEATFKFFVQENENFKAAYAGGTLQFGVPIVLVNMSTILKASYNEESGLDYDGFKDELLRTVTHEFIHAMQEWLGKEFDEKETEEILGTFKEHWNTLKKAKDEIDEKVVGVRDLFQLVNSIEAETVTEFKEKLSEPFEPILRWMEANQKTREEGILNNDIIINKPQTPDK